MGPVFRAYGDATARRPSDFRAIDERASLAFDSRMSRDLTVRRGNDAADAFKAPAGLCQASAICVTRPAMPLRVALTNEGDRSCWKARGSVSCRSHGHLGVLVTRPCISSVICNHNSFLKAGKLGGLLAMTTARVPPHHMPSKTATRLVSLRGKTTQGEIAKIAGVSAGSLSNWENDVHSPPLEAVARLAQHWKVTTDYLAGLTDYASALPADSWVIDLDFVDALKRQDGSHRKLGEVGAFAIPRRTQIASSVEYQTLQRELEQLGLVKKERGTKS